MTPVSPSHGLLEFSARSEPPAMMGMAAIRAIVQREVAWIVLVGAEATVHACMRRNNLDPSYVAH